MENNATNYENDLTTNSCIVAKAVATRCVIILKEFSWRHRLSPSIPSVTIARALLCIKIILQTTPSLIHTDGHGAVYMTCCCGPSLSDQNTDELANTQTGSREL